jgi:hypothetical protein
MGFTPAVVAVGLLAKVHKNAFYSVFFSLAFKLLVNNSQVNLNLAKVEE